MNRREILTSAALAAMATTALGAPTGAKDRLIINGLGSLDNDYGPPPPGPKQLISAGALADAKASGMSAINVTVAYKPDFDDTVSMLAAYDAFLRDHLRVPERSDGR